MLFLYSEWLALSIHTRHKIAEVFGLQKKGPTEVVDNMIKHDGYLLKDIEETLSVEKIQSFLGTDTTDMKQLWAMLIDTIEGRAVQVTVEPIPELEPEMEPNVDTSVPVIKIKKPKKDVKEIS